MEKDNIKLSRRISGGGAVYQDLGIFSFECISWKGILVFLFCCLMLIKNQWNNSALITMIFW